MPRLQTKRDLISVSHKNYEKLLTMIAKISEEATLHPEKKDALKKLFFGE